MKSLEDCGRNPHLDVKLINECHLHAFANIAKILNVTITFTEFRETL